jgi:DNA-binding CsgD family transcriptional regulator
MDSLAPTMTTHGDPGWGVAAEPLRGDQDDLHGALNLLSMVIDQVDQGLALLSADARVLLTNQAFRRACMSSRVVSIENQRLRVPGEQGDALLRALQLARLGRRTLLDLHAGEQRLWLATVPLGGAMAGQRQVLVVLGRRQLCEQVSLALFASHHRLTSAEAAVLTHVCHGLCPEEIARSTQVAVSTVRTQICSIRQKTGTSSVGDLVRVLAALPPLPPVMMLA